MNDDKDFSGPALEHKELRKRSIRGGGTILITQAVTFVVRFGSLLLFARLLRPEDFGLVAMVAPISGLAVLLKDLGLSQAIIQRPSINQSEINHLFWTNMAVCLLLMAVFFFAAPWVAAFYGEPDLEAITYVFAAMILFGGVAAPNVALLSRHMRFGEIATVEVVSLILGTLVGLALALEMRNYWALIAMQATTVSAQSLLMWWRSGWMPSWPRYRRDLGQLVRFGRNVAAFRILNYLANNLDKVMIGKAWGAEPLGLYDRATRLLLVPTTSLNRPLARVALPLLSRLQDEPTKYRRAYQRILGHLILLAMPAIVWAALTADWLIPSVLGPQWGELAALFVWLAWTSLARIATTTCGFLYQSQDRTGDLVRWGAINSTLMLASVAAGLPWGVEGVVIVYTLTNVLILAPIQFWWASRKGPVALRDVLRVLLPMAFGLALMVAADLALLFFLEGQPGLPEAALKAGLLPLNYLLLLLALPLFGFGRFLLADALGIARTLAGRL